MKPYEIIERYEQHSPARPGIRPPVVELNDMKEMHERLGRNGIACVEGEVRARVFSRARVSGLELLTFTAAGTTVRVSPKESDRAVGVNWEIQYPASTPAYFLEVIKENVNSLYQEKLNRLCGRYDVNVRTIAGPVKVRV